MSQKAIVPKDHNTSTAYFQRYYWCINERGTLYVLPIPKQRHRGTLFDSTVRLGRLSSVNWSSVKKVGGKKVEAIILGVVDDDKEKDDEDEEVHEQSCDDSFEQPTEPLFYMLDEVNFMPFEDHPQSTGWAKSDVVTAAYQRIDASTSSQRWIASKGKWLRDIFKAPTLNLTHPRTPQTPVFVVPPDDRELRDMITTNKETDAFFQQPQQNETVPGAYFFQLFSLDVGLTYSRLCTFVYD